MATIIGIVSQKGGVGKSTIARLLAREYAQAGWNAKIADLDVAQGTSFNWQARRLRTARERGRPPRQPGSPAPPSHLAVEPPDSQRAPYSTRQASSFFFRKRRSGSEQGHSSAARKQTAASAGRPRSASTWPRTASSR